MEGLNGLISAHFAKTAAEGLANEKKRGKEWDTESLRLVQKAARDRYQWLRLEGGRLSFSMPGTPAFLRNLKREILDECGLRQLRSLISGPGRPDLGRPNIKEVAGAAPIESVPIDPKALRSRIEAAEGWENFLSDNAWSLEQRRDHLTLYVGLGDGQPIRLAFEHGTPPPEELKFDDRLLACAQTISPQIKKDVEIEKLITNLLRENAPTKRP